MPYAGIDAEMAKAARGENMAPLKLYTHGRAANPGRYAAAPIPVERYHGPLLLIAGAMDQIWASAEMARANAKRRSESGLQTEPVVYPNAGLELGGGGSDVNVNLPKLGGTVEAITRDQRDAWARTRAFARGCARPGHRRSAARATGRVTDLPPAACTPASHGC